MYQQLVLFPCCTGNDWPIIVHMFGCISKTEQDTVREWCINTKAHPLWKANVLADKNYSYLPYTDFVPIGITLYEQWVRLVPSYTTCGETLQFIENKLINLYSKDDIMFLSCMYNIILYSNHVATSLTELLEDWCVYIRLQCPCSTKIHSILETYKLIYIPYDQFVVTENAKNHVMYTRWKLFCQEQIGRSYQYITNPKQIQDVFVYMITLPILWKIIDDQWRFIIQLFIDDSLHYSVIRILHDWVNYNGCVLCSHEYDGIPTIKDYYGNYKIYVHPIHVHLRIKEQVLQCRIYPTLEHIDTIMEQIPSFMLD